MLTKIEKYLMDYMFTNLICIMIGFIGSDQLLLHIPTTNLYGSVFVVVFILYVALIGLCRTLTNK